MTDLVVELIAKLQSSFENARNTGDLVFFPSTVVTHNDSDIEVIDIINSAGNAYRDKAADHVKFRT